jgi:putative addiction module component (TIGR02574 family)
VSTRSKPTTEQLITAALTLPPEEREEIAERLLKSLDGTDYVALSPAWRAEVERRMKEIDEGRADLVDGEQFLRWLRSNYVPPAEKRPTEYA